MSESLVVHIVSGRDIYMTKARFFILYVLMLMCIKVLHVREEEISDPLFDFSDQFKIQTSTQLQNILLT